MSTNFQPEPSIPRGNGTIDLANVQGFRCVDGNIFIYNNNTTAINANTASITLASGPEGDLPPTANLTCGPIFSTPAVYLERINFTGFPEPTPILTAYPNTDLGNVIPVYGALLPTYVAAAFTIESPTTTFRYSIQQAVRVTTNNAGASLTLNVILENLPANGQTFLTFIDVNAESLGATQTVNFFAKDGVTRLGGIVTTGETIAECTLSNPNPTTLTQTIRTIYTTIAAATSFTISTTQFAQLQGDTQNAINSKFISEIGTFPPVLS
jgi:hypothetical protein